MGEGQTLELLEALQFYLNQGGAFKTASAALDEYRDQGGLSFFQEVDLTGDGILELLAVDQQAYVFWCQAGFVDLEAIPDRPPGEHPEVLYIGDMNLDGVPEIVLHWGDECGPDSCAALAVMEGDGGAFGSLVSHQGADLAGMDAAFDVRFADLEGNGTLEILLQGATPPATSPAYREGRPWRESVHTYTWAGGNVLLA